MHAFFQLLKGIWHMSFLNKVWTLILTTVNLAIPLFFTGELEAQIALGVFFVNIVAMTSLTALGGYTRLVSLGHALWLPLIYYFWILLPDHPPSTFVGIWMRGLMITNILALLIDGFSLWRFVGGDQKLRSNRG